MSFSDLGLLPELLRAVADKGYDVPSAIQVQAIPAVLAGRDVLAGAQTGTGKTAGFVLPILQRLVADTAHGNGRAPRALVLTPTRELAAQVAQSARDYGKYVQVRDHPGIRRCEHQSADQRLAQRLRYPGGDAGSIARSRAAARGRSVAGAGAGARRGRSNARHGFHPGHSAHHQIAALQAPEPAVLRDLFRRHPGARRALAARSAVDSGGAAQCADRAGRTARLSRAEGAQAASAGAFDSRGTVASGADLHAHQAWRESPDAAARGRGHPRRCDPRQQESSRASQSARHVQARTGDRLGGDRGRRSRPRHQGASAGGQLRVAQRAGRLRASHRPHRPCGRRRGGDLAGLVG